MGIETLVSVIATLLGGLATSVAALLAEQLQSKRFHAGKTLNYNERIGRLTTNLTKASTEVDSILQEMAEIIRERQTAVSALDQQQAELQEKIDSLKNVPIEAAEFFTQYLQKQEQKSSRRDYVIFALGVGATTIISIIIAVVLHQGFSQKRKRAHVE